MLSDDEVLKNCYYWAKRLVCKGIEFNALVSIGYIVGKPLKDSRLLKDWIYYSMIKFICETQSSKNHKELKDEHSSRATTLDQDTNYIDLYSSLDSAGLTEKEKFVLHEFFFQNKQQPTIAEENGISQQTVHAQIQKGIDKVRTKYLKILKK